MSKQVNNLKVGASAIELIKKFEGAELQAYLDIAGVPTIGYGHTETVTKEDVESEKKITLRQAEELLYNDLKSREAAVNSMVNIELNQNEFDALVTFVYNVGVSAFRDSTLRKKLNMGMKMDAADQFTRWNKATVDGVLKPVRGLTRRREAEKALFLKPIS
jgi:lysozyme